MMTYANATHTEERGPRFGFGAIIDRIAAAFADLQETLGRRRVFRQTMKELGALSDRELADLAISRSMIPRIALDAAHGIDTRAEARRG
jgi:uncharacterized protein YjiS (DUF1127 family)